MDRSFLARQNLKGVGEGLIFGSSLFLFYIQMAFQKILHLQLALLGDDTVMYLALKPKSNAIMLYEDMDK